MSKQLKIFTILLFSFFVVFFSPFWSAVALAIIFSFLLFPLVVKLDKKHQIKGKWVILIVIMTMLILLIPFALGFYSATSRVMVLAKDYRETGQINMLETEPLKQGILKRLKILGENHNITVSKETLEGLHKVTDNIEENILKTTKVILVSLPLVLIHLLIFTLCLYVFLYYGAEIKKRLLDHQLVPEPELNELVTVLQEGCYQTIISLVLVGTVQSSVVLLGAWIAQYPELLLIFCITFILSFIPVIGAAPVAFFLSIIRFLQDDFTFGMFLAIVGMIAGTVDNVLKPLLLKRKVKMDGAISLISMIGAIFLLGVPGLFIGPVVGYVSAYYFKRYQTLLERDGNTNT